MAEPTLLNFISALAYMAKANPLMLDMARQQPTFAEIEQTVVALIANADSASEALLAYEDLRGLIPDWKFVFASDTGQMPGFSVNRAFSDGSVVRSLFSKERVLVLDEATHSEMLVNDKTTFPIDYSIALDTQVLSYLAPYLEGKTTRIPDDFHEIFAFIAQKNVFVDPIPYMTENLINVLNPKNVNDIRRRLNGYEMLRTIDEVHFNQTGEVRSTISQGEQNTRVDNTLNQMINGASNPETLKAALHGHTWVYCLLLKMATIQLRRPQPEFAAEKLAEFIEFMDLRLQTIFAREAIVAAEYFVRGQNNFGFFGRIQKGKPTNLAHLRNMAWDFWHIRNVEEATTNEQFQSDAPERRARYFFPSLLTCDKDFIEVIDLYSLKSYAYKKGTYRPIPFAETDWIAKVAGSKQAEHDFIQKYYSRTAIKRRDEMRIEVENNFDIIKRELEEEFCKVAQCA
ncbi:hypothetical protein [Gallionella capsiferriformans]|uniref:Uncharacterized protein n=1 Tax=Gallionella capsiferriformans (strain ES-2) TaxID=395494 RepID=D9SH50_GALCS|nr:hypothetical protein [Gallionella capsiferriformans]ADL55847.1 hypothetical protein Galf_1837 [Gallionella capsiferriformans ES-2]